MQNDFNFLSDEQQELIETRLHKLFVHHTHPEKSRSQFLRILNKSLSRVLFVQSLLDEPKNLELLGHIISKSDYFVNNLVNDPHLFSWLTNTQILNEPFSVEKMRKAGERAANSSDQEKTRIKLLKQFQRKHVVAIGVRDMLGCDSVYETTSYLSELADICLSKVSEIVNDRYFSNSLVPEFCVFGLGKYGGRELNYSSDIDLLAICSNHEKMDWKNQKDIFVQDILNKWIQDFISILTTNDSDGNFYRIDFRLRPEGEMGPLIPTSAGAINYYFSRGRTWERQMLLKIRPIFGSKILSDSFLKAIQSFVFNSLKPIEPSQHLYSSLNKVHDHHERNERNVKTSLGGIRSIEFFCQTLQLSLGNRYREFWNGNTIEVLQLLGRYHIIKPSDEQLLLEIYTFYRRIEHYLQFYLNRQTHELPESLEELQDFSTRFNGKKYQDLLGAIQSNKQKVWETINFYIPMLSNLKTTETHHPLIDVLCGYTDISAEIREMICSLYPSITKKTIQSFQQIISSFPNPSSLVQLWISNVRFLADIILLVKDAPVLVSQLLSVPEIWENTNIRSEFHRHDFSEIHLYQIHQEVLNTIHFLNKKKSFENYTKQNTIIYEDILHHYYDSFIVGNYLLLGFGKLASGEITFGSDADLTLVRLANQPNANEEELIKISQRFSEYTVYGQHFNLDFRLRPEGKNSSFIQSMGTYYSYFEQRAEYWEFLTYSRSRLIIGDSLSYQILLKKISDSFVRRKSELIQQFDIMRANRLRQVLTDGTTVNLKKDPGGLLDIEVFLQHYCLKSGISFSAITGKTIFDLCFLLHDVTGKEEFLTIKSIYLKLRLFETEQKLSDGYRSGIFKIKTPLNSHFYDHYEQLRADLFQLKSLIDVLQKR